MRLATLILVAIPLLLPALLILAIIAAFGIWIYVGIKLIQEFGKGWQE